MTTTQKTDAVKYGLTVGMSVMEGRGFYYPADVVIGKNKRMYVINRSLESVDRGVRVTVCDLDSEFYGTFGAYGDDEGQFIWAGSGDLDSHGNIYITDTYSHRVTVFDAEGKYLRRWGTHGTGDGEMDSPSGVAVDSGDNVYIADTYNNRIQKFSSMGVFLQNIGSKGDGEGQLSLPWGVTVAPSGDVYVADWGNDRIQRFTQDGVFVSGFGQQGREEGQFVRPASVAVDENNNVYVADWGNERVQIFDDNCKFVQLLRGEATLSKWAENFLAINKEEGAARSRADLEAKIDFFDENDPHDVSSHIEKYFWSPMSVKLDDEGRLYVTESNRHRIQVYERVS